MNNTYEFANIPVNVSYKTDYITDQCKEYLSDLAPEFIISVTDQDVDYENQKADREGYPYGYLESLAFYRKFCNAAVDKDTILFHSSAIAVDGKAYLFAAPSGTGKSTHTRLWRELFSERAVMINDDKPLLKMDEGKIFVYGTPWDGKHRLSSNTRAEVKGICFLKRGEKNSIRRLNQMEALPEFLSQTYRPEDEQKAGKMLNIALNITSSIPMWELSCNISEEAAVKAYEAMSGKRKGE